MVAPMRILVTGSTAGIGRRTAETLITQGHDVVLHARSEDRLRDVEELVGDAAAVVTGDLASLASTTRLAEAAAALGPYDALIHNAGIQERGPERHVTVDGLERTFQVNVLAPYTLTAALARPQRLVFLTSGLQSQGDVHLDDLQFERRRWDGMQAYADSKLLDVVLTFALARRWTGVACNAVDPGWIQTRMGGERAPGSLDEGADTLIWLATSTEPAALGTGRYLKQRASQEPHPTASDGAVQDRLLEHCAQLSGCRVDG
jgi:NAD(P)-dependent dehydrogenase (short-subunit alcohol dehydrogenase family)